MRGTSLAIQLIARWSLCREHKNTKKGQQWQIYSTFDAEPSHHTHSSQNPWCNWAPVRDSMWTETQSQLEHKNCPRSGYNCKAWHPCIIIYMQKNLVDLRVYMMATTCLALSFTSEAYKHWRKCKALWFWGKSLADLSDYNVRQRNLTCGQQFVALMNPLAHSWHALPPWVLKLQVLWRYGCIQASLLVARLKCFQFD